MKGIILSPNIYFTIRYAINAEDTGFVPSVGWKNSMKNSWCRSWASLKKLSQEGYTQQTNSVNTIWFLKSNRQESYLGIVGWSVLILHLIWCILSKIACAFGRLQTIKSLFLISLYLSWRNLMRSYCTWQFKTLWITLYSNKFKNHIIRNGRQFELLIEI